MRATETTKTKALTRVNTAAASLNADEKINGVIIASVFAGTALITLWSLASLIGGLIAAGGPFGLMKGYIQAFSGI